MKNKIVFSPKAVIDINSIYDYIVLKSFDYKTAEKTINGIQTQIELLKTIPLLGKQLIFTGKTLIETDFRYIAYKKYLIFYKYKDNKIYIEHIYNSRMDYISLLKLEDNE